MKRGFTLIETMVAVTLLVVSVAAPMSLTVQSLSSAFYARDQITAFHLAQDAVEALRSVRDGNILASALGTPTPMFQGVPNTSGQPFTIDSTNNVMQLCAGTCAPLRSNGELYGYSAASGWNPTRFTRTVTVTPVSGSNDEFIVSVEVRWRTSVYRERNFTISENLYRWVDDGAAS